MAVSTSAKREILLLQDYRRHFHSSVRQVRASMRIDLLEQGLAARGFRVAVMNFPDIDFRNNDYSGKIVLYQSSEDRDLFYKSYIEDIVLALSLQGARLIPPFPCLRAHHNKVFMELLRDLSRWPKIQNLRTKVFGVLEDFLAYPPPSAAPTPLVLKSGEGCQSQSVRLARSQRERNAAAAALSKTPHWIDDLKDLVKIRVRPWHRKMSRHRRKFVAQELIPDLSHDFKVIPCGSKVYMLRRDVRPKDFRASGSGLWSWIESPDPALLDFAVEVQRFFDVPYVSLDVAFDGRQFYLFEFQFLMFGTATIEKASWYFEKIDGEWRRKDEKLVVEDVLAQAIAQYVDRKWPV